MVERRFMLVSPTTGEVFSATLEEAGRLLRSPPGSEDELLRELMAAEAEATTDRRDVPVGPPEADGSRWRVASPGPARSSTN
jgi:hypothetical protein